MLRYETAIKADKFLVIVNGGGGDILRAHEVLVGAGNDDVQAHPGTA